MARKTESPAPLPCPCGRRAAVNKIQPKHWLVVCPDLSDCGFSKSGYGSTKDEAIINWNKEVRGHDAVGKRH